MEQLSNFSHKEQVDPLLLQSIPGEAWTNVSALNALNPKVVFAYGVCCISISAKLAVVRIHTAWWLGPFL